MKDGNLNGEKRPRTKWVISFKKKRGGMKDKTKTQSSKFRSVGSSNKA
jgi:hypothetical protein